VSERIRLTAAARKAHPDLAYSREQLAGRHGVTYTFTVAVNVEGYAARLVTIQFSSRSPDVPLVFVDGPADSPHRYAALRGTTREPLCLWYPRDPHDRRWVPDDGLLGLIALVTLHLFKEAWWRENDHRWIGEEAPHGDSTKKGDDRAA